ncbi:hypothetical protein [Echinicola vietnamensis]|uniref:hypothetical protein n=1 Tax=Echinicola vietnamensis TaxID=390884 RepID=UPI0002D60612|nr:hypothetical protein [Echinicola vietnamensis]
MKRTLAANIGIRIEFGAEIIFAEPPSVLISRQNRYYQFFIEPFIVFEQFDTA